IVDYADDIIAWGKAAVSAGVPSPPEWVGRIPLFGSKILGQWQQVAAASHEELTEQAAPYARTVVQWVAGRAGDFGALLPHLLLTVLITAILYTTGEAAASGIRRFARRLAGDRGDASVVLAGQAPGAGGLGVRC